MLAHLLQRTWFQLVLIGLAAVVVTVPAIHGFRSARAGHKETHAVEDQARKILDQFIVQSEDPFAISGLQGDLYRQSDDSAPGAQGLRDARRQLVLFAHALKNDPEVYEKAHRLLVRKLKRKLKREERERKPGDENESESPGSGAPNMEETLADLAAEAFKEF